MKYIEILAILSIILMVNESVLAAPQDIQNAALLAFAQVKDTFDNGAAASDKKEIEFMGAKVKNDMNIGFGDAIRTKRSSSESDSYSYSDEYYSDESSSDESNSEE